MIGWQEQRVAVLWEEAIRFFQNSRRNEVLVVVMQKRYACCVEATIPNETDRRRTFVGGHILRAKESLVGGRNQSDRRNKLCQSIFTSRNLEKKKKRTNVTDEHQNSVLIKPLKPFLSYDHNWLVW